jgi:hypothetical protein
MKCVCGHSIKEHSMLRADWDTKDVDIEKGERQTGDGHCFHFNFPYGGFCKCLKFEKSR